jgi:hypothetical protein
MDRPDLNDIARRPQQYWNVDGLPELVMGVLWMLWGVAWLVGEALPRSAANYYWMITPVLLAGSGVVAIRVIRSLKARVTFPRTGYVEWKEPTTMARLGTAAIAIVVAAVLAAVVLRGGAGEGRNAPVVLGVILSLGFLVASVRQHAPHLLALAGVALALGLAVGTIAEGWTAANWIFVGIGAATAALGALRLSRFISQNPRTSVEGA